jgi:hypothetical protein
VTFQNQRIRRPRHVAGGLLAVACLAFSCGAQASSYNAVTDFSLASNPNGAWSYLVSGTLLGNPTSNNPSFVGLDYWWNGQAIPNSSIVAWNSTGSTQTYSSTVVLPPNVLLLDVELNANVDVRFTAPATGAYSITGYFLGVDTSERSHSVTILDNGTSIFTGTIASYNQNDPFGLTETLAAGDTIDFESLTPGAFSNLGTGLSATVATVSATPEPGTAALIPGAALMLYGLRRLRTRRRA